MPEAVVIGASAGAIEALSLILPALPDGFPLPIVIVVHVPPDAHSMLAEIFAAKGKLRVKEAEDTEPLEPGTAYFAPPNYHVLIEAERRLSLSADDPVLYSRPSIDVLFESAADAIGESLIGVVLSGANSDGAKGLQAICAAGGQAMVQDPATAYASPMPNAALKTCPNALCLPPEEISVYLRRMAGESI